MKILGGTMLGVTVLTLVGCSDGSPAKVASSADTAPTVSQSKSQSSSPTPAPVDEIARKVTDALATSTAASERKGAALSAPGSLAEAYLRHQSNQSEAALDGGYDPADSKGKATKQKSGGYRICFPSDDGPDSCYTYANFKVSAGTNKLASFTVNGKSLRGRLSLGDGGKVATSLATIVFQSAYITASGDLDVTATVRSKSRSLSIDAATDYKSTAGRVRVMSTYTGPDTLSAQALSHYRFDFKGPLRLGGTMELRMFAAKGDYQGVTASVKVG